MSDSSNKQEYMPASKYGIANEGYPLLSFLALTTLACALIELEFLTILGLGLFFFTLHFFRDPERVTPQDANIAVSPADGKIIRIQEMEDPITKERKVCVSVFMNVFSVHVNRTPISGTIKKIVYFPGLFLNAALDKASTDNERCAYNMEDAEGNSWTFVQIAGLVARRIVCKVEEGAELQRGKRFGLIRFGSRVDIFLPAGYVPAVTIGTQVYAAETILAKKEETNG